MQKNKNIFYFIRDEGQLLKFALSLFFLFFISIGLSQTIKRIEIGNQIWMSENLNVIKFSNGDPILHARTAAEWEIAGDTKTPAWCYYNNNPSNGIKHGKLYNWYAVNDVRGLAPLGWHIPSDREWIVLFDYCGGKSEAGNILKSKLGWQKNGNGTDAYGFAILPSGFRVIDGIFSGLGQETRYWTKTSINGFTGWSYDITMYNGRISTFDYEKRYGFSVRCIKD